MEFQDRISSGIAIRVPFSPRRILAYGSVSILMLLPDIATASTIDFLTNIGVGVVRSSPSNIFSTFSESIDLDSSGLSSSTTYSKETDCDCSVFDGDFWGAEGRSTLSSDLVSGRITALDAARLAFGQQSPTPQVSINTSHDVNIRFATTGQGSLAFGGTFEVGLVGDDDQKVELEELNSVLELYLSILFDSGDFGTERGDAPLLRVQQDDLYRATTDRVLLPFSISADLDGDALVNLEPILSQRLLVSGNTEDAFTGFLSSGRASLVSSVQFTDITTSGSVQLRPADPALFAFLDRNQPAPVPLPGSGTVLILSLGLLILLRCMPMREHAA